MLLLTSLQGWGMVGIIADAGEDRAPLLQELKRLHNLGLSGGFLAIAFGLAMIALPVDMPRARTIYRVLLPALLVAPIGFSDRVLSIFLGPIPFGLQVFFYGLQAVSALGNTVPVEVVGPVLGTLLLLFIGGTVLFAILRLFKISNTLDEILEELRRRPKDRA
jgi:hypothetical protein